MLLVKKAEKIAAVKAAKRAHDEAHEQARVMMATARQRLHESVVRATDPSDEERASLAELSEETGLSISRLSQFKRGKNT